MQDAYFWDRLIHSIKTALTCLLGFALTAAFSPHAGPWLVVSIIVVMCAQLNVGSMIQKSWMRFLGTLAGSIVGALCIYLFPSDYFIFAIITVISVSIFSFIATSESKFSDAGTLGAVTVAIILVGQTPTLAIALDRFAEISLGILLAGLISQILFPVHARTYLQHDEAETLRELRSYYLETLVTNQPENPVRYSDLDEAIVKSLITQRKLAKDAKRELFGQAFNIGNFNQYLWHAREILRSMTFMHHAWHASSACKNIFVNTKDIQDFQDGICKVLEDIARGIENKHMPAILIPSTTPLKNIVLQSHDLSEDDMINCHAFIFCAGILTENLQQLSRLVEGNFFDRR